MPTEEPGATRSLAERRAGWWLLAVAVGGVAFLARLVPVLRTGGLDGIGQYDAAVYFGSAVGLVHGQLPYRDFLLLHPPGSTLALTPFAALGLVIGDNLAWSTARVAMMALGSLTAVLVAVVLRPLGLVPVLLGGLCYAVFLPAVAIETTTRLEPLAACCLAAALVLLGVDHPRTTLRPWTVALAGGLLGYAATVKIWGALPLVVVALYLLIVAGLRRAALFSAGAAAAGVAVCLPFLLAAPNQMWRQVVLSQFGREEATRSNRERLADITGLSLVWNRFEEAATWAVVGCLRSSSVIAAILSPPSRSDPASGHSARHVRGTADEHTNLVRALRRPVGRGSGDHLRCRRCGSPPCRVTSGVAPSRDWPGGSRAARDGGPAQPG